jgi:magnesium transporter
MPGRKQKIGLQAGSLIYIGEKKSSSHADISVIDYNENYAEEFCPTDLQELAKFKSQETVTWINIDGIHDVDFIRKTGEIFGLHPLLLEDILNPDHRPKIEEYGDYLHFTLKELKWNSKNKSIESDQISFVIGKGFVISFQEEKGDIFEPIRERIRNNKGRIRKMKSDYLAYTLIDIIVDYYFLIIDEIENEIELLESIILEKTNDENLRKIQKLKKDLLFLRKSVIPLRESVGNLEKSGSTLIEERTTFFLKDVYDHTLHIADSIETYREMLNSLTELHLAGMNNSLNKVMKVLTIISTIFIPLTFIVGVYGMNFTNMPEIQWEYGYTAVWGFMILTVFFMLYVLRRNKWM